MHKQPRDTKQKPADLSEEGNAKGTNRKERKKKNFLIYDANENKVNVD